MCKLISISRHRMGTDGKGVSTLVAFHGCPLHCKYCINDFCHDDNYKTIEYLPEDLYKILSKDDIYYRMTGGGIVFGGGEPLLNTAFIVNCAKMMPKEWQIRIETSLNVDWEAIDPLISFVDEWVVDIKDSNNTIYRKYTGCNNERVIENLNGLSQRIDKDKIIIRIPRIPNFNNENDINKSMTFFEKYGKIEVFNYIENHTL